MFWDEENHHIPGRFSSMLGRWVMLVRSAAIAPVQNPMHPLVLSIPSNNKEAASR